eukprot:9984126-Karenia_brevis.AAC.1
MVENAMDVRRKQRWNEDQIKAFLDVDRRVLQIAVRAHLSYDTAASRRLREVVPKLLHEACTLSTSQQPVPSVNASDGVNVEAYLERFKIQPHARDLLRTRPLSVKQMVLKRSMDGVVNATAVLMKWLDGQAHDLDAFVRTYSIRDGVSNQLRSLPQTLQQEIMKTSLTSARDRNSSLMYRIRLMKGVRI